MQDIEKRLMKCLNNVGIIINSEEELQGLKDFIDGSIVFITFIVEIEQEFKIEIPDDFLQIECLETIDSIKAIIEMSLKKEENENFEFENMK